MDFPSYIYNESKIRAKQIQKKYFSLILLTIRKLIFTRTHMHGIINQKFVILEIWSGKIVTEDIDISVNCPGLSSFIESLFGPRHCVWDTEQIRQGVCLCEVHLPRGLMNNPEAATKRLQGCIWLTLVFCLVHTVLNFFSL